MSNMKQQLLEELDRRIVLIEQNLDDPIEVTGNQYEELNQALSKVIGGSLKKELGSVKRFVESLSN